MVKWLAFVILSQEVTVSNLGLETGYLDLCFRGLLQYLEPVRNSIWI
jgi:hypothetical protein